MSTAARTGAANLTDQVWTIEKVRARLNPGRPLQ
jgi:hypothetical protein